MKRLCLTLACAFAISAAFAQQDSTKSNPANQRMQQPNTLRSDSMSHNGIDPHYQQSNNKNRNNTIQRTNTTTQPGTNTEMNNPRPGKTGTNNRNSTTPGTVQPANNNINNNNTTPTTPVQPGTR